LEVTLPLLRKTKGKIILTSSGAARHSYAGWGAYCATKAALKSLGDTLAVEEEDITTISVEPGTVDTDMQKDIREKFLHVMDEKDQKRFTALHEEGKLAKPEEPGHVMAKLVLDAPKELSGETFR
jgi:NAD(P)-dependent dehydrogenase (short-subunit alcohol dehydrogenase family)